MNQQADKNYEVWQASHAEATLDGVKPVWNGAQPLRLTYRVDAGQLGAPLAISCVRQQHVAYQEVPTSSLALRSIGVLDIQYPHPAGREGQALVGVVIQHQHGPDRGMPPGWIQSVRRWVLRADEDLLAGANRDMHEAWALAVPRADVERILGQLQSAGFYGSAEQRRGHVRIISQIGSERVAKDWASVNAMDELMHRIRSQGQLISFQGIALPLESQPLAPASVVAWRNAHRPETLTTAPPTQLATSMSFGQGLAPGQGSAIGHGIPGPSISGQGTPYSDTQPTSPVALFAAPHATAGTNPPGKGDLGLNSPTPQVARSPEGTSWR